jgi:hypothetical protein
MALPSRKQTFAYETCRDLVEKLDREIDRYHAVAGGDEGEWGNLLNLVHQLTDSAFNASVTAWHIGDWVFNDMPCRLRDKFGFKEVADVQKYARGYCRALHLCRQAATASKHWSVDKYRDPSVKVIVTAEGGWRIYFKDGDKEISADQAFANARDFWYHFIKDSGLARHLDEKAEEMRDQHD